MRAQKEKITLFVILLLGIALRVYRLGYYDFWYDELTSYSRAADIFNIFRQNLLSFQYEPPLFSLLLHPVTLFTRNEFVLRLFPCSVGVISVYWAYLLGKKFYSNEAGLIFSLLLAISPFHIHYSQELRGYVLLILLGMLSSLYFYRYLTENKLKYCILWIGLSLAALYLHNMAFFIIISQGAYLFWEPKTYRDSIKRCLLGFLAVFLCYLPWIFVIIGQIHYARAIYEFDWIHSPSLLTVFQTFNVFNAGYGSDRISLILISSVYYVLFFLGVLRYGRNLQKRFLLLWIGVPVLLLVLISFTVQPMYIHRLIAYILPAYLFLIACGILSLPQRTIKYVVILVILLHIVPLYRYYQNDYYFSQASYRIGVPERIRVKEAVDFVRHVSTGDAVVLHTRKNTFCPFVFKAPDLEQYLVRFGKPERFFEMDTRIKAEGAYARNIKDMVKTHDRIVLIFSDWEYAYDPALIVRTHPDAVQVKQYLDEHCTEELHKNFQDLTVFCYRR